MFGLHKIDDVWTVNENRLRPLERFGLRLLKRMVIAVDCINRQNVMSYASSLTYNTLLSSVPVMAIVFAVARGFGLDSFVETRVRESLEANPEIADTLLGFVESYIQHTRGGVFIGVGLIFLLYSLLSLTSSIEMAFNAIWHVRNSRNIYRRVTEYLSVFLLLPFVVVILTGFNIFLISFRGLLPDYQLVNDTVERVVQFSPVVLISVFFILLFKFMPNTKVDIKNVVWPGMLTGMLFFGVEYLYIHYQIKLSSYNAIYGSFAALPLFMIWLQLSWSICLVGGVLCYANQSMEYYAIERTSDELSRRSRDVFSLLLVSKICKRFAEGAKPYSERSLAKETHLPETLVRKLLSEMVNMQLLAETHNEAGTVTYYLPAIDVNRMTLKLVVGRIDKYGSEAGKEISWSSTPALDHLRRLRYGGHDVLLVDI